MSEYWIPENNIDPEKIKETEGVLNYIKDVHKRNEESAINADIMLDRRIKMKKEKKLIFNKFIYSSAYYFQFLLLSAIILIVCFKISFPVIWILGGFFISEIFILEESRRLGYEKIRYRKGCFFACIDLVAVTIFCGFFCAFVFQIFYPIKINPVFLHAWALYTFSRKIYIYKNFTYEK